MTEPPTRPPAAPGPVHTFLLMASAPLFTLIGFFPVFSLGVLTPFIAEDAGLSPIMAGLLATGLFGAAAVASVQAGRFVDRVGARTSLVLMCTCAAVSWLLASFARSAVAAVVAVAIAGVALGLAIPAVTRMFFTLFSGRKLGLSLGIAHSGTQLGAVVSGGILPTLAVAVGWRHAVRVAAILPAVMLLLPLVLLRRPATTTGAGAAAAGSSFLQAMRDTPGLWQLTAFAMVVNGVVNSGVMYLPSYAVTAFDLDLVTAGLTTLTMGIASIIGKVLWGASKTGSGPRGLYWFTFSSAAVLLLLFLAPVVGRPALWAGAALFGFTATTWAVPTTQVASLRSGVARSGTAAAAVMMAGFAGGSIGPPIFGWAVGIGGFGSAWFGGMLLVLSAALLLRRLVEPGTVPSGGHE